MGKLAKKPAYCENCLKSVNRRIVPFEKRSIREKLKRKKLVPMAMGKYNIERECRPREK